MFTPSDGNYRHGWISVKDQTFLTLEVRSCLDARIALSAIPGNWDEQTYEVVLGATNNTKSIIRDTRDGDDKSVADTPGVLDCEQPKAFWVGWKDGNIEVGQGNVYGRDVLLQWRDSKDPHPVYAVSFTVGTFQPRYALWTIREPAGRNNLSTSTCFK